jgi:hypothetical protein
MDLHARCTHLLGSLTAASQRNRRRRQLSLPGGAKGLDMDLYHVGGEQQINRCPLDLRIGVRHHLASPLAGT